MRLQRVQLVVLVCFVVVSIAALVCSVVANIATNKIEMPILSNMVQRSEQIYRVTVLKRTGPIVGNEGFGEWTYRCRVLHSYKGILKANETLYFHFTTRDNKDFREKPKGEIGEEYILFLRPASESPFSVGTSVDNDGRATKSGPSYLLVDQWLGILPWDVNLGKDVQRLLSKEKRKHNNGIKTDSQ